MRIEIELQDPELCDGCPCKVDITGNYTESAWCEKYRTYPGGKGVVEKVKRPNTCIRENGR